MVDAVVITLIVFGLAMVARGVRLFRRLRSDPPGQYTSAVLAISTLSVAIGATAFVAAALRSPPAVWTMAGLMLAVPVVRLVAGGSK